MRIKITFLGGHRFKDGAAGMGFWPCGAVVDVPDSLGVFLIQQDRAVAAALPPVVETAEVAPPENTAKRTAKPRARKGPQ